MLRLVKQFTGNIYVKLHQESNWLFIWKLDDHVKERYLSLTSTFKHEEALFIHLLRLVYGKRNIFSVLFFGYRTL